MSDVYARPMIEFLGQPKGFRKELEKLCEKHKASGILCEHGNPDLTPYHTTERKVWRCAQTNPTRVCGVLSNPVWTEKDVTFEFRRWGPISTQLDWLWTGGMHHGLSVRQIRDASGNVKKIGGIDMIAPDQLDDYPDFIVEKLN